MTVTSEDKRRRTRRVDLDIPADVVEVADGGAGAAAKGVILNLGPDGAFVRMETRAPQGSRTRLLFRIESHPIGFAVEGEVRWVRQDGVGLQFLGLAPYDRSVLDDYCQRRLEEVRGGAVSGD